MLKDFLIQHQQVHHREGLLRPFAKGLTSFSNRKVTLEKDPKGRKCAPSLFKRTECAPS